MKEYNVTIVIPHYNSPEMLTRLLKSIGNHQDVNTIVVDDKSNLYIQEYKNCISDFENNGVTFLYNESTEKGAGVCRNIALDSAPNSKWILFADADDYFDPSWYETISKYFISNNDIVFFRPESSDKDAPSPRIKIIQDMFLGSVENIESEERLRYLFCPPWSKLIKRKLIDNNEIRFDNTRYANDVMFSVKTGYYADKVAASVESIYIVDEVADSLTKQVSFQSLEIRNEVMCRAYCFLRDRLPNVSFNRLSYINLPLRYLINCVKQGFGVRNLITLIKVYRSYNIKVILPVLIKIKTKK